MIRLTEEQSRAIVEFVTSITNAGAPASMMAPIRYILDAINWQLSVPRHFDDLVDTVAEMLQNPRISRLNADQLTTLRRGILSPLELARFKSMLSAHQRECNNCGNIIVDYEVATSVGGRMYCHHCAYPTGAMCTACQHIIPVTGINKLVARALQRHTCSAGSAATPIPPQLEDRDENQEDDPLPATPSTGPPQQTDGMMWSQAQLIQPLLAARRLGRDDVSFNPTRNTSARGPGGTNG